MDYDFDDILKQFGVEEETPAREEFLAEEPAGEEFFTEGSFEEETVETVQEPYEPYEEEPSSGEIVSEEAESAPDPNDPFAAWAAAERANSAARRVRKHPASEENDEFRFEWQDHASGRSKPVRRSIDEEEIPAAPKLRTKKMAVAERPVVQKRREKTRAAAEEEPAIERKRRSEAREEARIEKERETRARQRRREEERYEIKASREAEKRSSVSREQKPRKREEVRESRRSERETYDRRRDQGHRQGWIGLVVLLIVLLMAGGGVIYAGKAITESEQNLPNVYVDNIAVGKMTREETRSALLAGLWQERASTPLTVKTFNDLSVEIDPTLAGTVMSLDDAVDAACSYGHDGNIIENFVAYVESILGHVDVNRNNASLNTAYLQQKVSELENMLTDSLGDEPYTVDIPGEKLIVTKGQGSMKLDSHGLLESVSSAVQNGRTDLTFTTLSAQPVMPAFDAIYTQLAAEPVDARYSDDGKFTVIPETVGIWYDVEGAKTAWQQAQPGETITIPVKVTYPATTAEFLENQLFHDLLGAMTTKYTNSGPNRCSNVRLATSKINGTILYPGDAISYNETVGARTEAAGFLPAPAYTGLGEDGVKDEIGGGACQVSSTLYCASIYAFLETIERTAHIYPVNYIQVGTDATVTIPEDGGNVMDLKFKNSKNFPVKIVGYTEETEELKTITFEIWGTLEENDYMPREFDNTYYWMLDYDRVIEPSYPDRTGYKIKFTVERYGFEDTLGAGMRTLTHREVYDFDTGEKVLDEIINPQIASGYAMDTYYNHG